MLLQPTQSNLSNEAAVMVRGQRGYVFESADRKVYCFVPDDCVYRVENGLLLVNEIAYFRSGWAVRNRRLHHPEADGSCMFPVPDGLVVDPGIAPVQEFLRQLTGWHVSPVSVR